MKKTITFTLLILFTSVITSFARNNNDAPDRITTLVINASVTVVLVDDEQLNPEISGKEILFDLVTLNRQGDTLVIGSVKKRNLLSAGIIYIPASSLNKIRINSDATVRSLNTLQIPRLDVVINGACYVEVSNIGELNFSGTDTYLFEQNREVRRVPTNFLRNKKY